MGAPQRDKGISIYPAIWGEDAKTTIPNDPILGESYRNTDVLDADVKLGQPYKDKVDSTFYNEVLYRVSSVVRDVERWGILPYSPVVQYQRYARCLGSNGVVYDCIQDCIGIDPVTAANSSTYWEKQGGTSYYDLRRNYKIPANVSAGEYLVLPTPYKVGSMENNNVYDYYSISYEGLQLILHEHYEEVGALGEDSTLVQINFPVNAGDYITMVVSTDQRYVPDYSFNFTSGIVDPRFKVVRSTEDYVLSKDNKWVAVPKNILGFSWNEARQQFGASLFGNNRTRLNTFYKSKEDITSTNYTWRSVDDATTQSGKKTTITFLVNTLRNGCAIMQSITYAASTYSVSVRARSSKLKKFCISMRIVKEDGTTLQYVPEFTGITLFDLSPEWKTYTTTLTVPTLTDAATMYIGVFTDAANTYNVNDTLEMDWWQVEKSPHSTPLIAGDEGTQKTVNSTAVAIDPNYLDPTNWMQYTIISDVTFPYIWGNGRPWQIRTRNTANVSNRTFTTSLRNLTQSNAGFESQVTNKGDYNVVTFGTLPDNLAFKNAGVFDFENKEFITAVNGILATAPTPMVNVEKDFIPQELILSSAGGSSVYLYGYLYKLDVYKQVLPDEELITLTRRS